LLFAAAAFSSSFPAKQESDAQEWVELGDGSAPAPRSRARTAAPTSPQAAAEPTVAVNTVAALDRTKEGRGETKAAEKGGAEAGKEVTETKVPTRLLLVFIILLCLLRLLALECCWTTATATGIVAFTS
jgi:hypothetical protein